MSVQVSKFDPSHPARGFTPEALFPDINDALSRIAAHCNAYRGGVAWRSVGQLALNLALFNALIAASYASFAYGFLLGSLALSAPAAGMLVRLFVIQHDCGHGSFFKSRRANHAVGWMLSLLTFTPYGFWRDAHNRHHASSGNLTRRGVGGVDTLTVEEYQELSPFKKWLYKFYRHPMTMFVFGPPAHFLILQRLPITGPLPFCETYQSLKGANVWKSVMLLNVGLVLFYGALSFFFGALATFAVFFPVASIGAIIGAWLFYIQHQYEDAYWRSNDEWDYTHAALFGSSHYALPKPLQWITGNIGLHHIHHLCSLIPNYKLQECYDASVDLQKLPKLTMIESLKSIRLSLWDEHAGKMVSFPLRS